MSNTYGAHIFKRRQVGEREEVKIKLFNPDGSPLILGSPSAGAMIWKGMWTAEDDFKENDVVLYDSGDGLRTYILTEDVAAGALSFPLDKAVLLGIGDPPPSAG